MRPILCLLVLFSVSLVPISVAQDAKLSARNRQLDKRAAEIEKMLPKTPRCVGRSIMDRDAWNVFVKDPAFQNIVSDAENVLKTPIPELPESLYRDFYQTGNRARYQKVRGQKYARLWKLVLGECIENKGRFILPLEEMIRSICSDPSWLLPAHDRNGEVYQGTAIYADLVSTDTSVELGLTAFWLGDKLSPEIRKLILDNVERRTFAPYKACVKEGKSYGMWWVSGTNNWNSVCHAGTVGAALTLIDSPHRRAWYIASAEHFMRDFFKGFTPDGYCSEGMGYWNYGFGNFVDLAEMVFQATDGGVDFYAMPLVRSCALFGPSMEVAPKQYAAFADCSITASPNPVLTGFLDKRLGLGTGESRPQGPGPLKSVGVYCFANSATNLPVSEPRPPMLAEPRTEFPDAGILICRPQRGETKQLAFVCKAGHNAEHHNHNDVGSFTVMYGGELPVLDPGGEVYTRRTFSKERYESKLLNSFGHPVPMVNGQLQKKGRKAEGKVLERKFTNEKDSFLIDYAAAYGLEELKKLTRQFDFTRTAPGTPNSLTITDSVRLEPAGSFETAFESFEPWTKESDTKLKVGKVFVDVSATKNGKPLPLEFTAVEIVEDSSTKKHPTRFGFKIVDPIDVADVTITIVPIE